MCPGCGHVWTGLHVVWGAIYVSCGAAQLIAGIFYLISLPQVHLTCNLWTGAWNIIIGITGGMVACFAQLSPRRQEILLYMAVTVLTANTVNAVLSEWGFYRADMTKLVMNHPYHTLITYACFATRLATTVAVVLSFVDCQLAFCSMHAVPKNRKKSKGSHEQVSDIEYIIPRPKPAKSHTVYDAYSQSWVFDAEGNNISSPNHTSSPYTKLKNGTANILSTPEINNGILNDTTHLIDNPVVHIEEASDDSTSNSDRKLCYMKSFSRSTSPAVLSASSSQLSLNASNANNPPIYECLEKLTDPTIYRTRLNSALSNKDGEEQHYQAPQPAVLRRVESISPTAEKVQYASLMKELQKAITSKKEPNITSPQSTNSGSVTVSEKTQTNSRSSSRHESSKNSDAEFSKELEAALQLIQDLESPNTIDTPSDAKSSLDGKPLMVWRNSDASESEKTLSAVGSLAEITSPLTECQPELYSFRPPANGKNACVVVQYSDSRSTSGYSSPTLTSSNQTPTWSAASSVDGSNNELGKPLTYSIYNTKSAAVISLYPQDKTQSKANAVTLVKISGETVPAFPTPNSTFKSDDSQYEPHEKQNDDLVDNKTVPQRRSSITSVWHVKSLLRRKKVLPKLCPELEGAIIKSESLAYLTKPELLARHQRNKEVQRQIEERVLQQLGHQKIESKC